MRIRHVASAAAIFMTAAIFAPAGPDAEESGIPLPEPETDGELSLEEALAARRSVRSFEDTAPSLETLAQLCWAAQGVSDEERGLRTAPSAGALYPLELYLATGDLAELGRGLYRYNPDLHTLVRERGGDLREAIAAAALDQTWIADAPAVFVIVGVPQRAERRYGARGERYTMLEAGHAAQNLSLQAVTLELGSTVVGAFSDRELKRLLELPEGYEPLYVVPVGAPATAR